MTAALAPISLAELDAAASLQTRIDRKYLVPTRALPALLDALDPGVRALEIDGERVFAYESVYFDTPALTSYLGAARRRRRRFKVRTRTYVDSEQCWVEVKTRGPRGATVKTRLPHEATGRTELDDPAIRFTTGVLDGLLDGPMAPTLVSTYDRVTLHVPATGPGPDSRTTIDTALSWTDADTGRERVLVGLAVIETKTGSTPSSTDRLLWRQGHRPVRISKYGTGMAVLHPDLPSTPWRRVIDRHVG
ncbi:polyphosphate polymerase domain-containing protein [Cellulomonas edaphi]|uniref:Polyphosphate polymerase domain-containing protein n=1 Tax=Cellulomonas edaphi TaxID=3053468 RepID=A0ABT7SAL5_9CELL|nr:polyphosphate polymerase domain-containing protein [Cellulomons edaphi]MDM7832554.1 polyphosphate polymerase domain-containing protein [Cellulomons edaphi]